MKKFLFLIILCLIIPACEPSTSQQEINPQLPSNKFVVSLPKYFWQDKFPNLEGEVNIFTMNQDGSDLELLIPPLDTINQIVDSSSDGRQLLISSSPIISNHIMIGSLYVLNLDDLTTVQLSDQNYFVSNPLLGFLPGAIWLGATNQIAFIRAENVDSVPNIFLINSDGSDLKHIPLGNSLSTTPFPLFFTGYIERGDLYYHSGHLANEGEVLFAEKSLWKATIDTGLVQRIQIDEEGDFPYISFAPVGNKAIVDGWLTDWDLKTITVYERKQIASFGSAFWSPDGKTVITVSNCIPFTKCNNSNDESTLSISDADFLTTRTIPIENYGRVMDVRWHTDKNQVLLTVYEQYGEVSELAPQILSLDTMELERPMENLVVGYPGFKVFWYLEPSPQTLNP